MTKRTASAIGLAALIAGVIGCAAAFADETVQIGQSSAVLMRPGSPAGSVILMPGGDGFHGK